MLINVNNWNRVFCKNNVNVKCFFLIIVIEIFSLICGYVIVNLEYNWDWRWFGLCVIFKEYG